MSILAWPAYKKALANPHAELLANALCELGAVVKDWTPLRALLRPGKIWHLHHPESVLYRRSRWQACVEVMVFVILTTLARWRGTRIVWTIHDLGSNDRLHPFLENVFWRWFTTRVDRLIVLSQHSLVLAIERFPALRGLPGFVIPHGHYRQAYPNTVTREESRAYLGLGNEELVILHFGLLREYKNVPHLVRCFADAAMSSSTLLISGKPFDSIVRHQVEQSVESANLSDGSTIRLDLHHIDTDQVQHLFMAADIVVLPYTRILNSGALILALSFNRPVFVPSIGSMTEHQDTFGSQWVRLYSGALTASELEDACHWARGTQRDAVDLEHLDWSNLAKQTLSIYEGL